VTTAPKSPVNPPFYETVDMRLCVSCGYWTRYSSCRKCGAKQVRHAAKVYKPKESRPGE
jgi:hypothetical protein